MTPDQIKEKYFQSHHQHHQAYLRVMSSQGEDKREALADMETASAQCDLAQCAYARAVGDTEGLRDWHEQIGISIPLRG